MSIEGEEQRELAERLMWELRSEGYPVQWGAPLPLPCEGGREAGTPSEQTWIALRRVPTEAAGVVAAICHQTRSGVLLEATSVGSLGNAQELAVAAAEALNGLRARVPTPAASDVATGPPASAEPTTGFTTAPPAERAIAPRGGQLWLGLTLVSEVSEVPAIAGPNLGMSVDLAPHLALALETFWPVKEATLAAAGGTATTRLAWARLGPRAHASAGAFDLSLTALVGPALVWTTADVAPPSVGTTDLGTAAMLSGRAALEFPRSGPVYAFAAGGYSQLVPRFRLATDHGTPPTLGQALLEGAFGLGWRWAGEKRGDTPATTELR